MATKLKVQTTFKPKLKLESGPTLMLQKMDLNQMDLSDDKKNINYADLNDEFGDVDISGKNFN